MKFHTENWKLKGKDVSDYLRSWALGDPDCHLDRGELEGMRDGVDAQIEKLARLLNVLAEKNVFSAEELVEIVEGRKPSEPISFEP